MLQFAIVVVAEVFVFIAAFKPAQRPASRPGTRVGALVVHRHLVFQSIVVAASNVLGETQLLGMRQASVGKPEALNVACRVDDQSIFFPTSG